jgi:type II secretory pathway pseudopilin PulG
MELLVVIAIIAIVAAMLWPALGRAKQRVHKVKCLSNFHQIGLGLKMYVEDNHQTFPPAWVSQIDATVAQGSVGDREHCDALGGKDPSPAFSGQFPPTTKRLVNPCVPAWEAFHCPADRGAEWSWAQYRPTVFDDLGNSYCFNCRLGDDYFALANDPVYNLGAKKESWPPEPSRFIMMHEPADYPWFNNGTVEFNLLHGAANPGKNFTATTINTARDKLVASFSLWTDTASSVTSQPS